MSNKRTQWNPYPTWAGDRRTTTETDSNFLIERLLADKGKGGGAAEFLSMTKIPSCMLVNGSATSSIVGAETGWQLIKPIDAESGPSSYCSENWGRCVQLGVGKVSDKWGIDGHISYLSGGPGSSLFFSLCNHCQKILSCRFESKAKSRVLEPLSKWVIRFRLCAYPDQSLAHTVCP